MLEVFYKPTETLDDPKTREFSLEGPSTNWKLLDLNKSGIGQQISILASIDATAAIAYMIY